MKIENESLKKLVQEKTELVKKGLDTTEIDGKIREETFNYIERTDVIKDIIETEAFDIKSNYKENKKLDKKIYNRLIELYRQTIKLSKEISRFKKELRENNKLTEMNK